MAAEAEASREARAKVSVLSHHVTRSHSHSQAQEATVKAAA